jgi:hypothetical protein
MNPKSFAAIFGLIVLIVLGVLIANRNSKEKFDFVKPYNPSDLYVPTVTNPDSGTPSTINANYDRIIHPSEICVYREPRDHVRSTSPYGIGFSPNLAINRDTYLNIFDMYENRLSQQCHPSQQGPMCDYLERVNPLFKGVSTFNKKPYQPNKLGTRAAKTVDELISGGDPLSQINDGYYSPLGGNITESASAKNNTPLLPELEKRDPTGYNRGVWGREGFEPTKEKGKGHKASYQNPVTETTVSSYDNATPSDLKEFNHTPKIIHPSESAAYEDQRATYFKNPHKLGFSKSSIVNSDTYHDQFDRYERREPAMCHPSNLYPVLDYLRTAREYNNKEAFSSGLASEQQTQGVPSNDTWDLKDPRLCTEKRIGCPRMIPKFPMKLYSKCYETNRTRLVNPIIDTDPYQYW